MITNTSFTITCIPDVILRLKTDTYFMPSIQYAISSISNSLIIHSYNYFTNSRQSQKVQHNNITVPSHCTSAFNNRQVTMKKTKRRFWAADQLSQLEYHNQYSACIFCTLAGAAPQHKTPRLH